MNFVRIEAGHYRDAATGLEIRKMGRTRVGRNGYVLPGWAVFHEGREVGVRDETLTAARVQADDFWTAKTRAEQHPPARLVAEAERQLEGNRQAERDAAALRPAYDGSESAFTTAAEHAEREQPAHPQATVTSALAKLVAAVREQVLDSIPVPADPVIDDTVPELVDRIVRRAQYEALKTFRTVLAGWVEGAESNCAASDHGGPASHDDGRPCGRVFDVEDIRNMINDAAAVLRVPKPVEL